MPRDATIEIAALLAPVPGPCATGSDVRYGGDHDLIREARRADDPALPQGVWRYEPKRADWATVEALASETLQRRSKDLQVAAWLAEALVQRHGFRGLAPGIALLHGLCERFWDGMFPELEPGDTVARAAPLVWLDERLPSVLREVPITAGPEERPYSFADHERAQRLDTIRSRDPKAAERAEASGAVTLAGFEAELTATPDVGLRGIVAAVEAGTAKTIALERLLDRYLGPDAPGLGAVRAVLQDIGGLLATTPRNRPNRMIDVARRLVGATSAVKPAPARPGIPMVDPLDATLPPIPNRQEAYRRLGEIAEFLTRNDPHSPVGLLLERAMEWGAMPLDQLIQTISCGQSSAPALFDLLRLAAGEPEDGEVGHRGEMPVENSTTE
jgi:type VI secretion system protein ImpA